MKIVTALLYLFAAGTAAAALGELVFFGGTVLKSWLLGGTVVMTLAVALLAAIAARANSVVRINVFLVIVGAVLAIFGADAAIQTGLIDTSPHRPDSAAVQHDSRSLMQVVQDLAADGRSAAPAIPPRSIFTFSDKGTTDSALGDLLPLAGISKADTVLCNEDGRYLIYKADGHGFNNSDRQWTTDYDLIFIGDSFTHGACVQNGKSFVDLLRAGRKVLNLGMSSNGPLLELATLREYGLTAKGKWVVWVYFEGNDISTDLPVEQQSPLLMRYLQQPDFKQGLITRQQDVDAALGQWLADRQGQVPDLVNRPMGDARIGGVELKTLFMLRALRNALNLGVGAKPAQITLFGKVFARAVHQAREAGSKIMFVYLPDQRRYTNTLARIVQDVARRKVLDEVQSLGVPSVDLAEVFHQQHPAPRSLFQGHYTEEGNAIVAKAIEAALRAAPVP